MVYSVFVTKIRVVELMMSEAEMVGKLAAREPLEIGTSLGSCVCVLLLVGVALTRLAVFETPRDAEPGWLKPGNPPVAEARAWLVIDASEDVPLSASGEYVNIGLCELVSLAVPFSTAAMELVGAGSSPALEEEITLLAAGVILEIGATDEGRGVLEASLVVGAGVGVMNDVDSTVSGSPVARGLPSGFKNVMAGTMEVKIVC